MIVLGVNAYHGDASVALLRDGELVAAVEEERFRRVKHWAGFPREALRTALDMAGVTPAAIDHMAISRNPRANLLRKALFAARSRPSLGLVTDRVKNAGRVQVLAKTVGLEALVDAVACLATDCSDLEVVFVGDGTKRAALESRAREAEAGDAAGLADRLRTLYRDRTLLEHLAANARHASAAFDRPVAVRAYHDTLSGLL